MEGQLDRSPSFAVAEHETCGSAAAFAWGGANRNWPLVAQLEPVLGEDFAPDAHFFVETWTDGLAAALESLRLRQQEFKDRAQQESSWREYDSLRLRFSAEDFLMERQRAREVKISSSPSAATHGSTLKETEEFPQNCERDCEAADSLTVQRARCLLGVEVGSSKRQIKTAYRRLVRLNHPDRLAGASAQAKQIATERTSLINMAYRLLCGSRAAERA